ncbi:RNA 2',3'-cyclic phosphodiesterase [Plantactinospora siamensis]|uniref:RNA 2',3'-cyclic phosphodiesterase n=1 Tax=Plantactinospora siamensis TaxID=555372 RepID=A0ABV6NVF1_9ACTN
MRLFVALYPPAAALDDLDARIAGLRIGAATARGVNVRLPDRHLVHVTLAFLGDVADDRLTEAQAALGRAAEAWRAADAGPPLLELAGGGRFGRGRFTILWVGLGGEVERVRKLSAAIRRELRRARLPHDRRPFKPHLTVARPGDRIPAADVAADRAELVGYVGPAWPATEMALVRSHLGPRPEHHRLAGWPLG